MSERDILYYIRHPFIVRLRFAFHNTEKLFLVTDYYNGGSLYKHIKKDKAFDETRAKFYAAELLLAISHLHNQNIIYRDLKLENVLMDFEGHIALTDFGLSKRNIDHTGNFYDNDTNTNTTTTTTTTTTAISNTNTTILLFLILLLLQVVLVHFVELLSTLPLSLLMARAMVLLLIGGALVSFSSK
jgi:serine/threonine protein kinase